MSKFRSNNFFKRTVVLFIIVYLFCSLTNIFFIPRCLPIFSHPGKKTGKSIETHTLHANNNALSFILITERSILDDDQLNIIKYFPLIFLTVFSSFVLFRITLRLTPPPLYLFYNMRYAYLSFSTLRI